MLKLFLASHGRFASGIKNSLEILLGNSNHLSVFDAYVDERSVQEQVDAFYLSVSDNDQVVLLSDLYGGSVNQVMYTYLERPNTMLVSGVNLALVLELAIREDHISEDELSDMVEASKEMLRLVKLDTTLDAQNDFF